MMVIGTGPALSPTAVVATLFALTISGALAELIFARPTFFARPALSSTAVVATLFAFACGVAWVFAGIQLDEFASHLGRRLCHLLHRAQAVFSCRCGQRRVTADCQEASQQSQAPDRKSTIRRASIHLHSPHSSPFQN